MNGKTYAYLDLAALPEVGAALLNPRPALVFRGDGTAILWANAAGARLFGAESIGALLERRIGAANPLGRQIARLAPTLPSAAPRLEILRYSAGFDLTAMPAACQRITLAGGDGAVLAVAVGGDVPTEPIAARAAALADAIAGDACLAAVIGDDGRIVGASGGFVDLSRASATIDGLVAAVADGGSRVAKRSLEIDGAVRPAGAARFEEAGEQLTLLIVGPADIKPTEADIAKNAETGDRTAEAAAGPLPDLLTSGNQRVIRFLWQTDTAQRFTFVSPELARTVGARYADIVGMTWRDVGRRLGLDADIEVQAALDRGAQWGGITVTWPTEAGTNIAATLSAFPVDDRGAFAGFRGFGILRPQAPGQPMPRAGYVASRAASTPAAATGRGAWEDERTASEAWEADDAAPTDIERDPAGGGPPSPSRLRRPPSPHRGGYVRR